MSATSSAIPSPNPTSSDWSIYLDNESFNVTGLDGTPTTLSFPELNGFVYSFVAEACCAGFALGFVSMLFIVLLLVTPGAKIRKPIFLLNIATLFLVAFREILIIVILCAPYNGLGEIFLGARAQYSPTMWAANILQTIIAVPIYATIMISLILQVRVVFAAEPKTRTIFTIFGALAVLVQTGFNMYWLVLNCECDLNVDCQGLPLWVYNTLRIFFCSFVGVACLIFLYKLGITIYRRHKMGMDITHFGPLQIIFIMFTQCLIVPRKLPASDPQLILCFSPILYLRPHVRQYQFCQLG